MIPKDPIITNQWGRSSIDELVLSSSRYNHQISSLHVLILARNRCFSNS